ncbi:MAG: cell division initiation protein [Actinomycetota bacterium]|jgi:cell division initiation protein|nr:cell division initiation protein [Actinomycetota bacterium]
MDLGARDVHEKQFHDAWRGYNQEEVDDFLDLVAENLDRLQRENQSFERRIQELDRAVSQSRNTEEMLKKTLLSAQKAANDAIATAKAKAEQLISEAEHGARRTGEEAHRRVAEMDREHDARKRELEMSIQRLEAREAELKRRLTAFLEQQKRSLEGLTVDDPTAPGTPPTGGQPAAGNPAPENPGPKATPSGEPPTTQERPALRAQEGLSGVRSLFRREENQK